MTYLPDPGGPSPGNVPNIPPGVRINLLNAQPSVESVLIGFGQSGHVIHGDLHAWLDAAAGTDEEFVDRIGQTVYLSATPGPYELEHSEQIVEQLQD